MTASHKQKPQTIPVLETMSTIYMDLHLHQPLLLLLAIYKFPEGEKVFLEKLIDRKQKHSFSRSC